LRNHAPVQGLYDLWFLDPDVYAGLSIAWFGLQGRTSRIGCRVTTNPAAVNGDRKDYFFTTPAGTPIDGTPPKPAFDVEHFPTPVEKKKPLKNQGLSEWSG
jgi:hypothetical protein